MSSLDEVIAKATRHVVEGRRLVEEQRKRIAAGTTEQGGIELLKTFERTLQIFEDDLESLLKERAAELAHRNGLRRARL